MAKLYFNYSSMNAGKSTALLQANHNYLERGMKTKMFTYSGDNRFEENKIVSRIGISAKAHSFTNTTDIFKNLKDKGFAHDIELILLAKKYNILILSWAFKENFQTDGSFFDKYFNENSKNF